MQCFFIIKARRFAATFRDGVSKGENRDSPLWLLVRIHFAPTLKFLKFKVQAIDLQVRAYIPKALQEQTLLETHNNSGKQLPCAMGRFLRGENRDSPLLSARAD